jgi:ornithine cyclodeaminase/alanine dehydrogenase-like protein (mu-crystallin family)
MMEQYYFFNNEEIKEIFDYNEGIILMKKTLSYLSKNEKVFNPLRNAYILPRSPVSILGLMPSYLNNFDNDDMEYVGVKNITVYYNNNNCDHQGVVVLFDAKKGSLLSISDASSITTIRTACVSAVLLNY